MLALFSTRLPPMTVVPGNDSRIPRHMGGEYGNDSRARVPTDALIAVLAQRQHGVVARRQLVEHGVGRGAVEARLRRGSLYVIHRGVYAVGHCKVTPKGRRMAAALACGDGAVVSHRSAGRCWGLLRGSDGAAIEVTRPRGHGARAGIEMHRASLPDDERTTVDGVPVTTVPRTIFDIAAHGDRRNVERAFHEAEVLGLTDFLSIPDLLDRYPGHAGVPMLRDLLQIGPGGGATDNDFEAAFADLIDRHRLPRPRFNPDLVVAGRHFRPDCAWMTQGVVVELDGRAFHATRHAFEADRARDRIFVANGWRVIRVTWRQLVDSPEAIVQDLRGALSTRSAFAVA
jgi:very-short-patch-repair endonuclease